MNHVEEQVGNKQKINVSQNIVYISAHTCTRTHTSTHTCIHTQAHIMPHMKIHTHTHTHTHTQRHTHETPNHTCMNVFPSFPLPAPCEFHQFGFSSVCRDSLLHLKPATEEQTSQLISNTIIMTKTS